MLMLNFLYSTIAFTLLTLSASFSFAQTKLNYIASEIALDKGISAHDKGNYKTAIKYFEMVHAGDSNYILARYEISNTFFAMEEYQQTIDISESILKSDNNYAHEFYNLLGSSYDELGNSKKAIEIYTKATQEFPMFYRTYYNRAITLERMGKMDSAILDYQSALKLNPYHASTHYKLGVLARNEGEIAKAMLCFNSYLLMEPQNNVTFLAELNQLAQGDFETNPLNIVLSTDDYSELNKLLNSKVALKKNYKTPNKLELPLVKQNYFLFEQLKTRKLSDGFWDAFYVPFFLEIMKMDKFNDMTYYALQSSTNDGIVKILQKNIKLINTFPDWAGDVWQIQHSSYTEPLHGEIKEVTYSWADAATVEGRSSVINKLPVGYMEYYYFNGKVNAAGNYDSNGHQDGRWKYYYSTGKLAGIENYNSGKLIKKDTAYWENGKLKSIDEYMDGLTNGNSYSYFSSGAPETKMEYLNENPHGEAIYYNEIGGLNYKVNYLEGNLEGSFIEYYPNQQISEQVAFVNDSRDGLGIDYYPNGSKKSEINYVDGVRYGPYKVWYQNGNIQEEGEYKDGVYINTLKMYNPNGSIASVGHYDDTGNETGIYQEFDKSGNLNLEFEYKKGVITSYKVFHKDGTIITQQGRTNKEFLFENYYSDGTKRTLGIYQPGEIGKNGIWKFFNKNGALETEEQYLNGTLNGRSVSYFPNGKKSETSNYINGELDGYYVDYYQNGQMKSQGYYVSDLQEGLWQYYQIDGTLETEDFFLNGEMNGPQRHFTVDGRLDLIEYYDDHHLVKYELYDTSGVVYQQQETLSDSSMYEVKSFTGTVLRKFSRKYFFTHGPSINYHGNSQESLKGNYFFREKNGEWLAFHENGKIEKTGEYFYGSKIGTWKTYNDEGTLILEENYRFGELHGDFIGYHDNGQLDYKVTYENNEEHGPSYYYDGNGVLQFIREYYYGKIVGYSYLGSNGNPIPSIPIKNETGKVTSYFKNGKVSREFEMLNGYFVGNYKEYYENGLLMATSVYQDGTITGTRIEYWDNGKIKTEDSFLHGYLNGIKKSYTKNGILSKTQTYSIDHLHGPTLYYSSTGKLVKTVNYYDGIIISKN